MAEIQATIYLSTNDTYFSPLDESFDLQQSYYIMKK